jgi:DmsE family decaheme c-type cytochrome
MRSSEAALICLALAMAAPGASGAPEPAYAGSETCGMCHEDIFKALGKSPHRLVDTEKKWNAAGHACEACHGPGQAHAESLDPSKIRNPAKLAPPAINRICLTCHLNQRTQVGHLRSSHARDAVACTTCHKVHEADGTLVVRKTAAINEQCAGCHLDVWAKFQQPNHHRLPEEAMSCVDCHNPHGSMKPKMTQTFASNEPGCFSCHGDKRGPFIFEHAPVRFEGCAACHEPHGSANPRMLTRQSVQYVCLECHANLPTSNRTATIGVVPPAFHDLRSPVFQNCTVCHQKIHGSHVDRNLLK